MRQAQPAAVTAGAAVATAPGVSPTGVPCGACPPTLVPAPALRSLVAAYAVREHVGASRPSCCFPAHCPIPVLAAHVALSGGLCIAWGAGEVQAPQVAVKYCKHRHGTLGPPQRPGCPHRSDQRPDAGSPAPSGTRNLSFSTHFRLWGLGASWLRPQVTGTRWIRLGP